MFINTFIFDLGGVIIDLNEAATARAFAELSSKTEAEIHEIYQSTDTFILYEKGLITDNDFRNSLRQLLEIDSSNASIDYAWNTMLGNIAIERLELLLSLGKKHKIVILSNTNAIHIRAFNKVLLNTSNKDDLTHFADFVFFSHDLNMRKPDMEIYSEALKLCNSKAEHCMFMDDKKENLLGAASIGINTKHITHPNQIFELESYVR